MKHDKKLREACDECEQDFIDEMNRLVGTVENYTRKDRNRKKEEVDAAFAEKQKQPVER